MNRRQKPLPLRLKFPAYLPAFERLDAALVTNTPCNNIEKIRLMRIALFGDVDRLQASGRIIIPNKIMARNGKIARLPREIRDELNRRLQDGQQGGPLLVWLNGLQVVSALLAQDFGGIPISKQNLCEWRAGGFAEWQARQETLDQARELAADANEITSATDGRLTDHLATVLAVRYAAALTSWNGEVTEELRKKLRALRGLCQDIVELRRGDHSGARLKMEQDRLEREREKSEEEVIAHFQRWLKNPAVRDLVCQDYVRPEERERRMREIFGLTPKPPAQPEGAEPAGDESNPVKPS